MPGFFAPLASFAVKSFPQQYIRIRSGPMLLDIALCDYELKSVPGFARHAESSGYDCLWTSETQHDPFLPLAVAAVTTSKIGESSEHTLVTISY
jgi:hypothetical protein